MSCGHLNGLFQGPCIFCDTAKKAKKDSDKYYLDNNVKPNMRGLP